MWLIDGKVIQARQVCARRGARHVSAEDLIFLIRDDRSKVNRLRTYMSWKDVRKNAKDSGGDGKPDVDEAIEDGADGRYRKIVHTSTMKLMRLIRAKCCQAQEAYRQTLMGYNYNLL